MMALSVYRQASVLLSSLILLGLAGCADVSLSSQAASVAREAPPFILVSIDGFRADYLERGLSPNLNTLAKEGAVGAMRPSFPSITFPNHYTLVTGKVPDRNGIVANNMTDARRPGEIFKMSNKAAVRDAFWWDEAAPMWNTAMAAGKKVGVNGWPGSEAPIGGMRPTYYTVFDHDKTDDARVDQILAWMDLPADQRPSVYLLYFNVVDTVGHDFGPNSPEVDAAITDVDEAIGRLRIGLKARGVDPNLVIVADHGMAAISKDRAYFLEDYLPAGSYEALMTGAEAMLNPTKGHEADLDKLTHMTFPHMKCWHKANIPVRYSHYGHNPRVAEIVCLADVGWLVADSHANGIGYKGGAHGYDQTAKDMAAVFIANGPSIKAGVQLKPFDNVDVYALEMKLMGLKPEPNDGKLSPLKPALRPE